MLCVARTFLSCSCGTSDKPLHCFSGCKGTKKVPQNRNCACCNNIVTRFFSLFAPLLIPLPRILAYTLVTNRIMTETPNYIFLTFELLGSLGLLIFGMKMMSDSLQRMAGPQLRHILGAITSNRFSGMLVGMFITCAVQSSSATTVMTVSFVSAGLLSLAHDASDDGAYGKEYQYCEITASVERREERDHLLVVLEVHRLAGSAQQHQREEHKCHAIEQVASKPESLIINKE